MRNLDLKFTTAGDYMATRSRIGIRNNDGSYTSVYVHWDGSPDSRMPLLTECWNETEKVKELIEGGGISSLSYTMENTVFYHRDRGEVLDIMYSPSGLDELIYDTGRAGEEYLYIFSYNEWTVRTV